MGTPIKQVNHHNPQQPQQQPETPGRFNAALDDIAKKLESATNKLGRPVTSSLPVPMESNEQDVDFLTVLEQKENVFNAYLSFRYNWLEILALHSADYQWPCKSCA